jgi:hypothetical protein
MYTVAWKIKSGVGASREKERREDVSDAFEKWLYDNPFMIDTRREEKVAKFAWDASRASTLAELERMVEELLMYNTGDKVAALSAIRAMKEGKG